jgi:hypothetical protein
VSREHLPGLRGGRDLLGREALLIGPVPGYLSGIHRRPSYITSGPGRKIDGAIERWQPSPDLAVFHMGGTTAPWRRSSHRLI